MKSATAANVLGALAQAIGDAVAADSAAAALVHLAKYPDEPIDALRRPLGLSHAGCVRLVDRLEEQGLVERSEGEDRRVRALRLTRSGGSAARRVLEAREDALTRAIGQLSANERDQLVRIATKVLAELVVDSAAALAVCRLCDYARCPDDVCPTGKAVAALGAGG
jgi:MarR family transcriptional regulator, negative regulator of the multidrug operon emrRAB